MKRLKQQIAIHLFHAVAAVCVLTACSRDESEAVVPDTPDAPSQTITVRAGTPESGSSTRLAYEEDGNGEFHGLTVRWKETNETFYVIYNIGNSPFKSPFYQIGIDSDNPKNATFAGVLEQDPGEDAILYAVYPDPSKCPDGGAKFDLSRQSGTLDGLVSCMYNSKVYKPSEDLNFSFRYLSTALKLTLELPNEATGPVEHVILKGLGADLLVELNPENRENPTVISSSEDVITISGESFAVDAHKATVYLSFCPGNLLNTEIQVWAIDANRNRYIGTLEGADLDAGILYHATVAMIKDDNKFENETEPGIDGSTREKAYTIRTGKQLKLLADCINGPLRQLYVNKYYKLTNDIGLEEDGICGPSINGQPKNWTPINNSSDNIAISLDGGGHTISGLYVNSTGGNQGLFGYLNGKGTAHTISNVILKDPQVSGDMGIGALGGDISNMAGLSNCHVTGDDARITGTNHTGGLVGILTNTPAIACSSSVKVDGKSNVGGLIGSAQANVVGCYATGNVTRTEIETYSNTGGLIGHFSGTRNVVAGCYATGNVTGNNRVGGLIGCLDDAAIATSCYTTSEVTGTSEVGAIIGKLAMNDTKAYYCGSTKGRDDGIGNQEGGAIQVSCLAGQELTALHGILTNYAAQDAWGDYSIKSEMVTVNPVTYTNTIEPNRNYRILNGTTPENRIWENSQSNIKLWWEQ